MHIYDRDGREFSPEEFVRAVEAALLQVAIWKIQTRCAICGERSDPARPVVRFVPEHRGGYYVYHRDCLAQSPILTCADHDGDPSLALLRAARDGRAAWPVEIPCPCDRCAAARAVYMPGTSASTN